MRDRERGEIERDDCSPVGSMVIDTARDWHIDTWN